ncbi:hypothetical protein F2Q70_00038808 [Brassica cretica]|uniref:Uncharacterized protein n=1 Tax=Brassica cretica TaxID=69181 RepID=A0A8S9K1P4_BRACR|nr:hypothetical protein F2Q70_00038808 [Brassica cretica]
MMRKSNDLSTEKMRRKGSIEMIESWAGQCNLSDVSLLAEDTARTGWLEWMGSLQFESRDMMDSCVDKAVKPNLLHTSLLAPFLSSSQQSSGSAPGREHTAADRAEARLCDREA